MSRYGGREGGTTHTKGELPPNKGFEHVKRFWDKSHECYVAKIIPGEFYVSTHGEMITTILGSCISACIYDRKIKVGGMNHFMLPDKKKGDSAHDDLDFSQAARYGNWAMEFLINEIIKRGGTKANMEVKLFGGGRVIDGMESIDIGRRNILFALHYVHTEDLNLVAKDVGGNLPRKVVYFPETGKARVKSITKDGGRELQVEERRYKQRMAAEALAASRSSNDIDLF